MANLGKNISKMLSKKKMTQVALAEAANVSQVTIHKLLTGKAQGTRKLPEIAKALGCTVEELTGSETVTQRFHPEKNIIPLIPKSEIINFCKPGPNNLNVKNYAGDAADFIAGYASASNKTFAYVEDINSMPGTAPPGSTVLIDPKQEVDLNKGTMYLFKVRDQLYLGEVQETPSGLILKFQNNEPGWEAIPIDKNNLIGKFLGSFIGTQSVVIR